MGLMLTSIADKQDPVVRIQSVEKFIDISSAGKASFHRGRKDA